MMFAESDSAGFSSNFHLQEPVLKYAVTSQHFSAYSKCPTQWSMFCSDYQVAIPGLPGHSFQPDKLCTTTDQAKNQAAEYVLLQLGMPAIDSKCQLKMTIAHHDYIADFQ